VGFLWAIQESKERGYPRIRSTSPSATAAAAEWTAANSPSAWQMAKMANWQTGKTATMDAQGEGQISGNQTMDKRNRFEYEMRWDWHTTGGPKNGSCLWLTVGGLQLRSGSWNRRCPDSGSKSKWQSPRSRLIFQSMPAAVAVYLECANFQSRTSIFVWTLGGLKFQECPALWLRQVGFLGGRLKCSHYFHILNCLQW